MRQSGDLIQFEADLEYGKYITFALSYIKDNKETIKNSIDGLYRNTVPDHPMRAFESKDINWINEGSVEDVYKNAFKSVIKMRMIHLKTCIDGYYHTTGLKKKVFYDTAIKKCPTFIITMPNGESIHCLTLLKMIRDELVHAGEGNQNEKRRLGISDMIDILTTPIHVSDNWCDCRVATYDLNNDQFRAACSKNSYRTGFGASYLQLYDVLEAECASLVRLYDAISKGEVADEQDCINRHMWTPIQFV